MTAPHAARQRVKHVYIHVPFCARRCSYCDFAIAVRRDVPSAAFVDALLAERDIRGALPEAGPVETLYLGGGTPSRLAPAQLHRLITAFARAPGAEVTLEANPDDVTPDAARLWVDAGVTRVSLGIQSFNANALTWMHRTHTAEQARRAVPVLRGAGIRNLSLDLIFGLPPELPETLESDLAEAVGLAPDHLSVYGLTVEPRTPLARWVARGTAHPVPDARYRREFFLAHERLGAHGFDHYEVSSYARPTHESRHNSAYWDGSAYLGLGPSAHGFDGSTRRWNEREWRAWDRRVAAGEDPVAGRETLSADQVLLERHYLGLRTSRGVDLALTSPPADEAWTRALDAGWLEVRGKRMVATTEGWLRLDALIPFLTTSARGG